MQRYLNTTLAILLILASLMLQAPATAGTPNPAQHQILQLRVLIAENGQFYSALRQRQQALHSTTADQTDTHQAYLDLALFYMANGMYKEAYSLLSTLQSQAPPEYSKSYDIALTKAVAALFAGDLPAAYDSINMLEISTPPEPLLTEVRMWYSIIEYLNDMGDNMASPTSNIVQLLAMHDRNFMAGYTDDMINQIAMIAFDNRIKNHDFTGAEQVNNLLLTLKSHMTRHQQNQLLYEQGVYYHQQNQLQSAISAWNQCADDVEDRENRAKCRFHRATLLYKTQQFSMTRYMEELQKIDITWRGDSLEREIMKELGELYLKQHDVLEALRVWQVITDYHANTNDALMIAQRMSDTFVDFFQGDTQQDIKPYQAVALFYEFQNLVPLADAGDELIIKLSAYLVDLDLLGRAAVLLNHLVDNRLRGMRREEIINHLAMVYIDSGQPSNAIEAIAKGNADDLPERLANNRRHIHSIALMKLGQGSTAEQILDKDNSQEASDIRADLYWQTGNWQKFSQNASAFLQPLRIGSGQLGNEEILRVMQVALVYVMLGSSQQLQTLQAEFQARIPSSHRYGEAMKLLAWLSQAHSLEEIELQSIKLRRLTEMLKE